MHTIAELETNVPAFLGKLWKLVDDPETDDLICWAPNGRSFFIKNTAQFARELLPHYYKHNNMASFVRQLNMYGFHKKVSIEVGGLKCDRDEMEFAHQYFVKDHPYLLDHIKRKIASTKTQDGHPPIKTEVMNKVLNEVRSMRGRQEHLDTRLGAMKRENEALWRELAMLRRKHLKQQEIVNKLIHFLVTLVQPSRSGSRSVKRRYPLMIDAQQQDKNMKMSKPEKSPTGPVIHELDPSEHEHHESESGRQYVTADLLETPEHPAIQSPASIADILDDETAETVHYVTQTLPLKDDISVLDSSKSDTPNIIQKIKKKGRKNKVPIKILIPPSDIGEEAREEMLMLETSLDDPEEEVLGSNQKSQQSRAKSVPVTTVRSSKLAAMARNINKMSESEAEMDSDDADEEQDTSPDLNTVDLEDILIIPGVIGDDQELSISDNDNGDMGNDKNTENFTVIKGEVKNSDLANDASCSSDVKDWSLSCFASPTNIAAYRLGSKEEVGSHVVSVQNDLDQLRDTLLNEGYSIDANTLLGLFGSDDPMSFGIPMNPELNPSRERDDSENIEGLGDCGAKGEIMAYTPSMSLLDFDDDILLDANNLEAASRDSTGHNIEDYYSETTLEPPDNKNHLLESLVTENDSNLSTNS